MNITKFKDNKQGEKAYDHQDVEFQDADYYEDYVDTMETAKQENAMLKKQMAEMQEMILQLKNQLQTSQPYEKEKPAANEQQQQTSPQENKLSDNLRIDNTTGKYIISQESYNQNKLEELNNIRMNIKDTKLSHYYFNDKGQPVFKWNIADIMTIIDLDPELQNIKPKFNDMTQHLDRADGKPYTQDDTTQIKMVLDEYGFFSESHGKIIEDAVQKYASQCHYNPLQNYLRSCRDDYKKGLRGKYTIEDFFIKSLGAEDDKDGYIRTVTRTWFLNAAKIAMYPGSPVRNVPILMGSQGIGKTTVLRKLAANGKYFSDEVSDFSKHPKDSMITMNEVWLGEMGEGKVLKYNTAESLKAFLTKYKYDYRPPYGKYSITVPRHTVFVITTNASGADLLNDSTGNSRYDVVPCSKDRIDKSYDVDHMTEQDVTALWGEAMVELEAHPEYLKDGGMKYPENILRIQQKHNDSYNFTSSSEDVYDEWMIDNYDVDRVSAHQLFYLSSDDENKAWSKYTNKNKKDVLSYLNNRKDDKGNNCFSRCMTSQAKVHDVRGDGKTRCMRDAYDVTPAGKEYFETMYSQQCNAAASGYMSQEDKNVQDQLHEMMDANFPDDNTD